MGHGVSLVCSGISGSGLGYWLKAKNKKSQCNTMNQQLLKTVSLMNLPMDIEKPDIYILFCNLLLKNQYIFVV
jgi:hypothetical protein